jgi:uncharacterized phage-associated protein
MPIQFELNPEKLASAVAYLAERRPGLTKKQICKLLYFADKEHLLRYGRTITGDRYNALPHGHVPSAGLDVMNGREKHVGKGPVEALRRYGKLNGWVFEVYRSPDLKVFSRSDREVLDKISNEMGHLTAKQLEDRSHQEPSYKKTEANDRVAFELFFEGHPEAELIKEAISEEPSYQ